MLILKSPTETISRVKPGGWFSLPDGSMVSPAYAGWTDGIYSLTEEPPEPPAPPPSPAELRASMRLSFAQLLIGLVSEGWVTEEDGRGWLQGVLPPTVTATINLLQPEHRFAATAKATTPSVVLRLDPLVGMMATAQGRSEAEVDTFFLAYSDA